ncbi:MAG: PQQ-binding-like beta-propeller repeat protein [Pirellulaceae bacterium]|nr:PQQ-binding-like beta-propeller repeat protein [Pirellulaceae bacterium]
MGKRTLRGLAALLLAAALGGLACGQSTSRTWTDSSGSYRIQAAMEDFKSGEVHLRRDDGKLIQVPLSKLSDEDRAFVRAEMLRRRNARNEGSEAVAGARSGNAANSAGPVSAAAAAGEWPRWRGPLNDGKSAETGLLDRWDAEPPVAWRMRGLGSGYSSLVVSGGKIFTMGERRDGQFLIALDQRDGTELWATRVGDRGKDGPNGTPTVDGQLVYAIGIDGDLLCAEVESGREVWRKSFANDFGGRMMSGWGYSESPLVDGDRLICTPGGAQAMLAALDKRTGRVIWTTPMQPGGQRGQDGAGYSSIVISQGAGVKQYVQLVGRAVIGVAAENGQPLWAYDRIVNGTANIPTPIVDGDFVFCSSGYGDGGSALLRLSRQQGGVAVQEVYYHSSNELQNHHGGMVLLDGYIYMGHGHNRGLPVCVEMATGRAVWGPQRGPGGDSAAIVYADGHLYFRYQDGTMALIKATPDGYELKGTFRADFGSGPKWAHPVIADGHLYLRSSDELVCYDIRKSGRD